MERGIKKGKAARKRLFALVLALAMVLTSVSVPSVTAEAAKNVKVKKIQITNPKKKTVTLVRGKTLQIKVKVTPKNAKNKKVTYKSSKKKIASVSKKGKVKGLKKGTAKITVTAKDGSKKKATLTVKVVNPVKVSKVTVSPSATTLDVGKTVTLKAACAPKNATDKAVSWKTSDKGVATVTASGVVKGVKAGTAKITATAKDGSKKSAACTVTVKAASVNPNPNPPTPAVKALDSIAVTKAPTKTAYYTGDKFDPAGMEVTASYTDKSTKVLAANEYTLSPSVDTSLRTTNRAVTVSYTEGGVTKTATTPITVTRAPTLQSIAVKTEPTRKVYEEGEKFNPDGMTVEATYSDGSTKTVTGYTYPEETLEVTAGAEFSAITISYTEGSKTVTAEVLVTVTAKNPLTSISVELKKTTLEREGGCFQEDDVTVTATFTDNSTKTVKVADCIVDPAEFTKETTSATVSYWYGGEKKSDTVSGFRVTAYREKYTFEDADTIGTLVRRANESSNDIPTEENAGDITPQFVPGLQGQALKMDGTYGVRLDKIAGTGSQSYSISMWVKPEAFKTSQALVISTSSEFGFNGNPDGETWCAVADADNNGTLKLWSRDEDMVYPGSNGWVTVAGSPVIEKDKWSHIVLVVDGTTTAAGTAPEEGASFSLGTLYVNGKKVASGDVFNEKFNGRGPKMKTYFGANAWFADGYYKGLVDEFVFTSEVLTESDVETYYIENAKATGQISEITAVSPDDGEEIEVEYGTSLADVKSELMKIAYTAKAEGAEAAIPLPTTSDMWTLGDYTITSTGEVEATLKLQAPDGYLFKLDEKLSVTLERKVTVKIKNPVTISAVTPSQTTMEVPYGTSEDAIKDALAALNFTVATSDSSAYEIANAKSLWTLEAAGDNYKAIFDLKTPKPGYKYADGVKVEVTVTVKQPIDITALTVAPNTLTVDYNTPEADVKDELANLAISATVAAGSEAPGSISNTADIWTIADYNAEVAADYTAKATVAAPVGYKFSDGVGEVTVTVTVKQQGEHKLSSIRVTKNPRLKYIVGDSFDKMGMVVTANYEDGAHEDVTAKAVIGTAENLQLGTQEMEISYTEGEAAAAITKTCKLTITTVKVEDGAAAHYTFDDTLVNDECKGTVASNAPTATWVKNTKGTEAGTSQPVYGGGVKGNAVQVGAEGATDIIKLDKTVKGTDFSINMWVKPLAVAGGFKPVMCSTTMASDNRSLVIYAKPNSAGDIRIYRAGPGETDITDVLTVGKWTMLTWVNKGNTIKLYADGKEINSSASTIAELPNIFLGGHGGAFGDPVFQGMYDEVGIYDSSLSQDQVTALYNSVTPTIAGVTANKTEIEILQGDVGENNAGIQAKLKELEIQVTMNNGTAPSFTNDTDWTLTGSDTGYTATKELAVPEGYAVQSNKKLVLTVNVIVKNTALSSINVTKNPTKTIYIIGETFDKAGMEVTATYDDNSSKPVEGYTVKDESKTLAAADTTMTVSYEEGGVTKETTVAIQVMTAQEALAATRTGYYTFDDTLENAIAKEGEQKTSAKLVVHGTLADSAADAAASYEAGKKNKAILLGNDTAKNIVQLDKNVASSKFTINLWVNPTKLEASRDFDAILFSTDKTRDNRELSILSSAHKKDDTYVQSSVRLSNGNSLDDDNHGGGEVKCVENVLTENTWTMLTWVNNGDGTMALYKDGASEPVYSGPSGVSKLSNIYLGGCWWDDPFRGLIDEVSIFDGTALTTEQIGLLKQETEAQATE